MCSLGGLIVMIERVILKNYRQFEELEFNCNLNRNIFIGDNGAGKSTILEAIRLVLVRLVFITSLIVILLRIFYRPI